MPQATLNYSDIRVSVKLLAQIFSHITVKDMGYKTPCWLYTTKDGSVHSDRYYRLSLKGTSYLLHRLMYILFVDRELSIHHQCDHLCRNKACFNPIHIEGVTPRENYMRGTGLIAVNSAKTHCPQGHEYTADNLIKISRIGRVCKMCSREHNRKKRRKQGMQDKYKRITCYKGHPFSPENTIYTSKGSRRCRTCKQTNQREWYHRTK